MSTGTQIAWDDSVLPFQLDASGIRGRIARLDGVLDQVLKQHAYPSVIEALVAETAVLTALIGQTIKLRWKLSLQVRGKGPARLIATDYYGPTEEGGPARMRAYASRTGLHGQTRNSITQLPALERELARVRQYRYAQDNEELELGVRCMAAGIYDDQGKLVAGLSISAPADRLEETWLDRVRATAAQISTSLGYRA